MSCGFPFTTSSASGALKRLMVTLAGGALAMGAVWMPNEARALLVFTVRQVGTNVVVYGNGSLNTQELTLEAGIFPNITQIQASTGELGTGPDNAPTKAYSGLIGPEAFGTGSAPIQGLSQDDPLSSVYICTNLISCGGKFLFLSSNYVNNSTITSTTIFPSASLSSLGLIAGSSFEWTWGTQQPQVLRLDIEPVPAPLPVLGAASAFGWSRRLRRRIRGRLAETASTPSNS